MRQYEKHYHVWRGNAEPGRPVRMLTREDRPFRTRQAAWQWAHGQWEKMQVLECRDTWCRHGH